MEIDILVDGLSVGVCALEAIFSVFQGQIGRVLLFIFKIAGLIFDCISVYTLAGTDVGGYWYPLMIALDRVPALIILTTARIKPPSAYYDYIKYLHSSANGNNDPSNNTVTSEPIQNEPKSIPVQQQIVTISPDPNQLSPQWEKRYAGNKSYYQNHQTQTTQWEHPSVPSEWIKLYDNDGNAYYQHQTTQEITYSQPSMPTEEVLPAGWSKVWTPDGKPYYQNNITKTTQWDRPEPFNSAQVQVVTVHVPEQGQTNVVQKPQSRDVRVEAENKVNNYTIDTLYYGLLFSYIDWYVKMYGYVMWTIRQRPDNNDDIEIDFDQLYPRTIEAFDGKVSDVKGHWQYVFNLAQGGLFLYYFYSIFTIWIIVLNASNNSETLSGSEKFIVSLTFLLYALEFAQRWLAFAMVGRKWIRGARGAMSCCCTTTVVVFTTVLIFMAFIGLFN